MDEATYRKYSLWGTWCTALVVAVWTLISGANLIVKDQEAHRLAEMKLGDSGLYPRASTALTTNVQSGKGNQSNEVSGSYSIKNIGEIPIRISEVQFYLFERVLIDEKKIRGGKTKINDDENGRDYLLEFKGGAESHIASFSLSKTLATTKPLLIETIEVDEVIAKSNELQRSFGFVIADDGSPEFQNKQFIIVAKAKGAAETYGLVELHGEGEFFANDLTHISDTIKF